MRSTRVGAVAVVGVLAVAGCTSSGADQGFDFVSPGGLTEFFYEPADRQVLKDISGPDLLTDDPITLEQFAGDVVVINIWGQWCPPYRAESDDLEQTYAATTASGVSFLGIDVKDGNRSSPQDFVRDRNVPYPSIYDPSLGTLAALGGNFPINVTPSTIVLDRQHRVAAIHLGELTQDYLQPVVMRVAAEP